MGKVRPFLEQDISQVADLHRRVFRTASQPSPQLEGAYHAYFKKLFLNYSQGKADLHSLVHEEGDGTVTGFLGVMPRPMLIGDKPVLGALSSQFIVDPSRRFTLAGLQLLKAFLAGPQDLSYADESSDFCRTLWNGFGGSTAFLQSIYWARILRPTQFLVSLLAKRRGGALIRAIARPACRIADAVASAIPGSPLTPVRPVEAIEEPTPEMLLECISQISRKWTLRPAYESRSLQWLLATLKQRQEQGPLRMGIVRGCKNKVVGWYIYCAKQGGLGEVLQVGAEGNSQSQVLDQLFFDAWEHGVAALSGRLEPEFMDELRKKHCLMHHRGYWTLIHSRNRDVLEAVCSGDAFLTRLEGEWCLHFHKGIFDAELASNKNGERAAEPARVPKLASARSSVHMFNRPI